MKWRILSVGKPALAFAADGAAEYFRRLRRFGDAEWITLRASDPRREGAALLEKSEGCLRLVLDERGRLLGSRELAAHVGRWTLSARRAALLVGGADGLDPSVRDAADLLWSLSPLTLQHDLALLVALEQLYRAATLRAGMPYHRD